MENRVFLTLIWLFQKKRMHHEVLQTRECFTNFKVRELQPSDYVARPMKQLQLLINDFLRASFYKRAQRVIKTKITINNVSNIVATIKTHFTEKIVGNDNNLYLVFASNNDKNINPLIIGVFKNTVVLNDNGIIVEIDGRYENNTHKMTALIKLYSTN